MFFRFTASTPAVPRSSPRRSGAANLVSFFSSLPPCLIGIEACSSAHHWARSLVALGHQVKLIPPAYVKPYDRRNKNDAVDAAAICEAVGRPNMCFVAVRSVENQAQLMRHRVRELLVGNRTRMLNALRGHLAEIGIVAAQGVQHAYALKHLLADGVEANGAMVVPDAVRKALVCKALAPLVHQIDAIDAEIAAIDQEIKTQVKADDTARRLMTIPGIGPLTAAAIVTTVPDTSAFASGRPGVCGVPRPDTAPERDRRQGAARADHQDGRPLLAQTLGGGGLRDAEPSHGT